MNKSLISFNRDRIYVSLKSPDLHPSDEKLRALILLINELGKFGYIIDSKTINYLDISDIKEYTSTVLPILYDVYKHQKYSGSSEETIDLKTWKSRHISDFYDNGDFRFIYESSNKLSLPMVYLDKMTDSDLQERFTEIIKIYRDLTKEEIGELSYLITLFKADPSEANNKSAYVLLNLYSDHSFGTIKEFTQCFKYKFSRNERRLILEKLETLVESSCADDLVKEAKKCKISKSEWKTFFNYLHPSDYKNVFPGAYDFYISMLYKKNEKKEEKPQPTVYEKAKHLLDSNPKEFVDKFGSLMLEAEKLGDGSEADIASLLCIGKLDIPMLLQIIEYLQKRELGIPRFYGKHGHVCKKANCFSLRVIPTVKEFILKGMSLKNRNCQDYEKLSGKKVWLDPLLKEYDYPYKNIRPEKLYLGKLNLEDKVQIGTYWRDNRIYYSYTATYLWKGIGKGNFKLINHLYHDSGEGFDGNIERNIKQFESTKSIIPSLSDLKNRGYKYIVFYNRTSLSSDSPVDSPVSFIIYNPNNTEPILSVDFSSERRNRFGGLLDLETGDCWILNTDLTELPTYNGNIEEAIVRYMFDSLRFSAYDYYENYYEANGASIVDSKFDCDMEYTAKEYARTK